MKKYTFYIILLLATMTACNDLNKYPKDAVSSETFFQNASQLEQYSNQFYSILPSASSMYEEISDEIACTMLAAEARGTRIIPVEASSSSWTWGALRHINYLLEHVNQCKDPQAAKEYAALARFFRAYFYYDKVRRFGDVPWINHTIGSSDSELYKPRDSRCLVMDSVISDLDYAIANMSADKSNVFLANRYAAMALKSRVCLFEGTFCKYHTELPLAAGVDRETYWKRMLTEAAKAAQQLINEGGYAIYSEGKQPYRDLFTTVDVQSCSEYIMARGYNASLGLKHNATGYTTSPTTGRPGFTKRFVNQYLCSDGQRFTDKFRDTYATMGMGAEMDKRDPRMEQTIFRPSYYVRIGNTQPEMYSVTVSATGYQLIKYVMDASTSTYNNSDRDMPLFRIAEVYLNYAEAKAELGESGQDIDDAINAVRDRVGMKHFSCASVVDNPCWYMETLYPNVCQTNKGVILEVRRERDIELVEEGFRYWDLMRWKEGKAFEQPYLGIAFKGVSKSEDDDRGFVDIDNDGWDDICAWTNVIPFSFGVDFFEVGKDIVLSNDTSGGCILSNGTPGCLNNGRVWREDRDYLYPIPRRERILSNGALSQNPGWDDGLKF